MTQRPSALVVLAAGEGTRMKSTLPKVLHRILGRTLLGHVLVASSATDPQRTIVVVGHGRDAVTAFLADEFPTARTAIQDEQRGTGHAVRIALETLVTTGDSIAGGEGPVVVLAGDAPLITSATLLRLLAAHAASGAAATVLSAVLDQGGDLGRIVRDADGQVIAIVEKKDADATILAGCEVNSGIYAFDPEPLRTALARLTTDNAAGEEYLTDVLALLHSDGLLVDAIAAAAPEEVLGVNDRVQLAEARSLLRDRVVEHWMRQGVTIVDPRTTWIGVQVELAADCTIHQNTQLHGRTRIAAFASIGPDTTLRDVVVEERADVRRTEATGAQIGPGASVGPFSYLRPGTVLAAGAKVGAYVETKNAVIGEGSKVPHLSYVGDAEIGRGSNIGAATIFANYDGVTKHRTVIGDHVRVGSDTILVAPLSIGDGAYTAAGSVIDQDVPAGALGVGRARQRNVDGWVARRRTKSPSSQDTDQPDHSIPGTDQVAGSDLPGELHT